MDEFFTQRARDLEVAKLGIQDCYCLVAMSREKSCNLELSLTTLYNPAHEVQLQNLDGISPHTEKVMKKQDEVAFRTAILEK